MIFTVTNTGNVDGREVVQIYVQDVKSSLPRPIKELKGFSKISLEAGKSKKVAVDLDRDALSFYDDRKRCWVAEAGSFNILVGGSSVDVALSTTTELMKTITWTGL